MRYAALSYERQPLQDNAYYGDVLLRAHTLKLTMKLIVAGLALAIDNIVSPE